MMSALLAAFLLFSLSHGQANYIYVNQYYTYAQAEAYCMSQYSTTLAVFDSLDSVSELQETIPDWESPQRAFIGLNCLNDQSTWQMVNDEINKNFCQGDCASHGVSDYWAWNPTCADTNNIGQCAVVRRKFFDIDESVIEWPCDDPQRFICNAPTNSPTTSPTTTSPTTPSPTTTTTLEPSKHPTSSPTTPSPTDPQPSPSPTNNPTKEPTISPTKEPTGNPIEPEPTSSPTTDPSKEPTESPTDFPTEIPTDIPSQDPTEIPTNIPTEDPLSVPSIDPTPSPTDEPSEIPTKAPSKRPTHTNLVVGQPNTPSDNSDNNQGEGEMGDPTDAPITNGVDGNDSGTKNGADASNSDAQTQGMDMDTLLLILIAMFGICIVCMAILAYLKFKKKRDKDEMVMKHMQEDGVITGGMVNTPNTDTTTTSTMSNEPSINTNTNGIAVASRSVSPMSTSPRSNDDAHRYAKTINHFQYGQNGPHNSHQMHSTNTNTHRAHTTNQLNTYQNTNAMANLNMGSYPSRVQSAMPMSYSTPKNGSVNTTMGTFPSSSSYGYNQGGNNNQAFAFGFGYGQGINEGNFVMGGSAMDLNLGIAHNKSEEKELKLEGEHTTATRDDSDDDDEYNAGIGGLDIVYEMETSMGPDDDQNYENPDANSGAEDNDDDNKDENGLAIVYQDDNANSDMDNDDAMSVLPNSIPLRDDANSAQQEIELQRMWNSEIEHVGIGKTPQHSNQSFIIDGGDNMDEDVPQDYPKVTAGNSGYNQSYNPNIGRDSVII